VVLERIVSLRDFIILQQEIDHLRAAFAAGFEQYGIGQKMESSAAARICRDIAAIGQYGRLLSQPLRVHLDWATP